MENRLSALLLLLSIIVATNHYAGGAIEDSTPETKYSYSRNNYKRLPVLQPHRSVIVHLDRWSYDDIANECATHLNKMGYAAVQISPITPHAKVVKLNGVERLSVASYEINNESGNENQLVNMITKCRQNNVRVLIDVVLNNMMRKTDNGPYMKLKSQDGQKDYGPENEPAMFFNKHFHTDNKKLDIGDYVNEKDKVREGQLDGLDDLRQIVDGVPNVHMIGFLYKLIMLGAAGFRIINADHMNPEELVKIYEALPDLPNEQTPTRPFIYSDVYDPYHDSAWTAIEDKDYVQYTRVTDYKFAAELAESISRHQNCLSCFKTFHETEIGETKTKWNLRTSDDSVVFLSTAMTHIFKVRPFTPYPEFAVDKPFIETTLTEPVLMKISMIGLGFMLTHGHGVPLITSPYMKLSSDKPTPEDTRLIHRWETTKRTMAWRNYILKETKGEFPEITNWQALKESYQVAYCVGTIGLVVINHEKIERKFNNKIETCFKKKDETFLSGLYCDIFGGGVKNKDGKQPQEICAGNYIQVQDNGEIQDINVPKADGMQLYTTEYIFKKDGNKYVELKDKQ